MKKIIIPIAALVLAGAGLCYYYLVNTAPEKNEPNQNPVAESPAVEDQNNKPSDNNNPAATTTVLTDNADLTADAITKETVNKNETVIGKSAGGRDIIANHFGSGDKEILFVGGIHGGYAWNTSLFAYQLIDRLKTNPNSVPGNLRVTIIPVLNPDGLSKVTSITGSFGVSDISASPEAKVAGRFNANTVDINRNFDCNWTAAGVWQNKAVSGGSAPFSEPESSAIRDYAANNKLTAVIAWYSAGGGVYSSSCGNGILPETQSITDIYAQASGYAAHKNFESYQVSGDMTDWFAKKSIPAIGVLLTTTSDPEWNKNWAGVNAILEYYAK